MINIGISKNINDDDLLGRAVFSSGPARRASRGNVDFRIFFHEKDNSLSVDRFGFCQIKELTNIQDRNAGLRSLATSIRRSFYGWASVKARIARRNSRAIQAAPTKDNLYHADINLPESIKRDEKITHAKELASNSEWISRFNE